MKVTIGIKMFFVLAGIAAAGTFMLVLTVPLYILLPVFAALVCLTVVGHVVAHSIQRARAIRRRRLSERIVQIELVRLPIEGKTVALLSFAGTNEFIGVFDDPDAAGDWMMVNGLRRYTYA